MQFEKHPHASWAMLFYSSMLERHLMEMGMGKRTMTERPTGWVEGANWSEQSLSRNRKYHAQRSWHNLVMKGSLELNAMVAEYENTVIKDATGDVNRDQSIWTLKSIDEKLDFIPKTKGVEN